jgi:hypothetical protein
MDLTTTKMSDLAQKIDHNQEANQNVTDQLKD